MIGNWIESLSPDVVLRTMKSDVAEEVSKLAVTYSEPPRLASGGALHAVVDLSENGCHKGEHSVELTYAPDFGVVGRCSNCAYWRTTCLGVAALLLDLAVSPELRLAILGEGAMDVALLELAARRHSVRAEALAARLAQQWIGDKSLSLPAEFRILPNRGEIVSRKWVSETAGFDPLRPNLSIQVIRAETRTKVGPRDPFHDWLAPEDARVLRLASPAPGARKLWQVSGIAASMALQLLRERNVSLQPGGAPLRFHEQPVSLRIRAARLPRWQLLEAGQEPPSARARRPHQPPSPEEELVDALEGRWFVADESFDISARDAAFFSGPFPYLWVPGLSAFFPVAAEVDPAAAWAMHARPAIEVPASYAPTILASLQQVLRGRGVSPPTREEMGLPPLEVPRFAVLLRGSPLDLQAVVQAEYSFGKIDLWPDAIESARMSERAMRDFTVEADAVATVVRSGLVWDPGRRRFEASGETAATFWSEGVKAIRHSESPLIDLRMASGLKATRVRGQIRSHISLGILQGELSADASFESDGVEAEMEELRRVLREKRRWVVLRDGSIARLAQETAELLSDVVDSLGGKANAALPAHQLGRIDHWAELCDEVRIDEGFETLRAKLRAMAVSQTPELPSRFSATLRPYQSLGLAWLQFLDALGAGGILADDMGLGKTIMTLALLQWRAERDGRHPSLVVCPTSVMTNWVTEAARFTPSLRTMLLYGAERSWDEKTLAGADLVVTTYAILRKDVEAMARFEFRYVVLDEAQNIKNSGAATTLAAKLLRGGRRLALTGTPVENSLTEFWSLLDFCNPGMLGTRNHFERRFGQPVSADPAAPEAASLRAIVRPFVLRRTKGQVLQDLPPKQEIDLGCTLAASQRRVYDTLAAVLRGEIEQRIRDHGLDASRMNVLTALLRLRQAAIDPRLIDPRHPASLSAKREAFLELVRELREEGRRALVFSQFVEVLSLWSKDLDREGIRYQYLDGSTVHRADVVDRFQNGTDPLFLISLKAGGTGLNLTAADTVIHCDPWWNPAVEDQATDRTHRIGQTRAVTVYRLIARGTVEDRIQTLKASKREIALAVLGEQSGALRGLSEEDIRLLLGASDPEEAPDDELPPSADFVRVPTAAPAGALTPHQAESFLHSPPERQ